MFVLLLNIPRRLDNGISIFSYIRTMWFVRTFNYIFYLFPPLSLLGNVFVSTCFRARHIVSSITNMPKSTIYDVHPVERFRDWRKLLYRSWHIIVIIYYIRASFTTDLSDNQWNNFNALASLLLLIYFTYNIKTEVERKCITIILRIN